MAPPDASAVEGGNLVFHVSIAAPTDHDITFQAFTDTGSHTATPGGPLPIINFGTATPGNMPGGDYDGFTQTTYTIHAGDTSVDVSVPTRHDLLTESTETMSLRLQNAVGATIQPGVGTGRGIGTIIDNPPTPVTHVSFWAEPTPGSQFNQVVEGNDFTFHFHRDVTTSALDVHYWMNGFPGGTATPGTDFTADGTTFTFVPGVPGSPDFEMGQDHWTNPSMVVHFGAGQSDATLILHATTDGSLESGEAVALQWDFAANGPNVQYDGAASNAGYHDAGAINPTQVNIMQILDHMV